MLCCDHYKLTSKIVEVVSWFLFSDFCVQSLVINAELRHSFSKGNNDKLQLFIVFRNFLPTCIRKAGDTLLTAIDKIRVPCKSEYLWGALYRSRVKCKLA